MALHFRFRAFTAEHIFSRGKTTEIKWKMEHWCTFVALGPECSSLGYRTATVIWNRDRELVEESVGGSEKKPTSIYLYVDYYWVPEREPSEQTMTIVVYFSTLHQNHSSSGDFSDERNVAKKADK